MVSVCSVIYIAVLVSVYIVLDMAYILDMLSLSLFLSLCVLKLHSPEKHPISAAVSIGIWDARWPSVGDRVDGIALAAIGNCFDRKY